MKIALYAAVAQNGVIGRDGGLPWRLPTDLRRFRDGTMGKPLVMGRVTWQGLPRRPLPGRTNIVVTGKPDFAEEGAIVAATLEAGIAAARREGGADEVCIIGGGSIYAQAIAGADRLHITHVRADIEGDTLFPPIDPSLWYAVQEEDVPAGDGDSHATRHVVYERRRRPD